METSKRHTNSKTKQRHEHMHIIHTHFTSFSDSKHTGEDTTPIHHKQHLHTTWLQRQPLYTHSTTQHNINNIITTGFNQNKPPERTLTVALDMSKAFDKVNIHTLTHKLHQTNKAYTTLRYKTSTQRLFENGAPQCGVLSPTLFNIYTSDTPTPQAPVKLTTYADDITITSTHNDINMAKANIQSYLHGIHTWTRTNNLILNPDKTTCTLFTPDPVEYSTQLEQQIDNITLPMNINSNIRGLTLDPRLTCNKHRNHNNKSTQANTDTQSTHINTIGKIKGVDTCNIQSHNKTQTRIRVHRMATTTSATKSTY